MGYAFSVLIHIPRVSCMRLQRAKEGESMVRAREIVTDEEARVSAEGDSTFSLPK